VAVEEGRLLSSADAGSFVRRKIDHDVLSRPAV
jgi:hypothetical protein